MVVRAVGVAAVVMSVSMAVTACGGTDRAGKTPTPSASTSSTIPAAMPSPTWEPAAPLPTVAGLDGLVAFLGDHGVICDHTDVENEGATAVPEGPATIAMCYPPSGGHPLELSIYRSAQECARGRPGAASLPCASLPELSALDGRTMTIAEGDNFSIRAADSRALTPSSLASLNQATEDIARRTLLQLRSARLSCDG